MRHLIFIATFLLFSSFGISSERTTAISLDGRLNTPFISHHGGKVYLHVSIHAPKLESRARRPMNLAVVLDRSGSMADDRKIDYAKKALHSLIDQLEEKDLFSLVIYDDEIDVLTSGRRVTDKRKLHRMVDDISPRNTTNLGGGMLEGFAQVEKNLDREYVNRVILISDGLANRGIVDPYELRRRARTYRNQSISLTTIGVGLDYNENMMVGLSESGGGNYYFIESPRNFATIVSKEFNQLSAVVAQNAMLELSLGRGVRLHDVIGCERESRGDRNRIPLGDIYSGEYRELTFELEVPEGTGSLLVARGELQFDDERGRIDRKPSFTTTVRYTRNIVEVDKNRDLETQAKVDVALSTRSIERAMKALDEGKKGEALQLIQSTQQELGASPAAMTGGTGSGRLREQRSRLDSYKQQLLDSADARRAKKAIQFENYQVQRGKK
ncbi:MAG: VWA domain-containing protein [bacterium]